MRQGEATVVKNAGSHYVLSALPAWEVFPAVLRGKIRLKASEITNPIAVGDRVRYEWADETPAGGAPASGQASAANSAVITEILPRKNYVIRRSTNLSRQAHIIAANVDMAYLIVSLYFPEVKLPFLDRILVTCEVYGIPATIVLSKTDLYREPAQEEIDRFRRIYERAGYPVLETSVLTGEGISELRDACQGKINLFSGESGVGKSSLIKALDPALDPKIGTISAAHLQGKHTTSLYEMYPLATGGYVIDSPGLRGFGLVDLEKEEIARYFPEMLRAAEHCRFTPCTHTHEPGCAVKAAVEEGTIAPERYNSYLGMLEEDKKFR
jgi:ribosome biogenesis GTPase